MEGTADAETCYKRTSNHPSAYGGYERRHHGTNQRSESSLRIRRVPLCRCTNKFCDRIIPPHTEGTPSPGQAFHRTPNHPSAYGGYDMGAFCNQFDKRIIPPHTEGTLRKINVFRWSMGNVCQYTIWFFASSHRPLLYARFVLILSCPSPFHHQICPIFSEKKKNSKKNHVFL